MKKPRPRFYPRDFACFCRSNTKFGTKVKCLHYPLLPVLHSILWPFEIKRKIASSSCWTRYWIENPHSIDWGRKVRDYRFPDQQAVDLCDWRFHYAKGTRFKKVGIFLGMRHNSIYCIIKHGCVNLISEHSVLHSPGAWRHQDDSKLHPKARRGGRTVRVLRSVL